MGVVLAKFRKEKSSADILEKLETDIRAIEKFSVTTQDKQKRLVGNFLVFSIGLYAVGFIIFYFVFFPPTWPERITYSVPMLIFPLLIFFLRRLLAWYFQRKLNKNSTKLKQLRDKKRKVLDEVMEKETYNVASKLLSRYGDKSYEAKSSVLTGPVTHADKPDTSIRPFGMKALAQPIVPSSSMQQMRAASNTYASPVASRSFANSNANNSLRHRNSPSQLCMHLPRTPRPFPIINQKAQSLVEKMVDYLIGDGPQNRYALICKECFSHNGMALREEFEYATFRCAFCNVLNPSRKVRPVAPRLPEFGPGSPTLKLMPAKDESDSSDSSDDEEDDIPPHHSGENIAAPEGAEVERAESVAPNAPEEEPTAGNDSAEDNIHESKNEEKLVQPCDTDSQDSELQPQKNDILKKNE